MWWMMMIKKDSRRQNAERLRGEEAGDVKS
jgi:hypothetical protein